MIGVGHNAGARDARVYSHVRNFKSSVTDGEQAEANARIFSVCSLFWNLVLSRMPNEVVQPMLEALAEADVPRISAPNENPGK